MEAEAHPSNGHAWLNLAHIAAALGTGNGVELYDRAIAEYGAADDQAGLVMGHIGRSIHRAHLGAPAEEVFAGLGRASAAADASGQPLLRARVDAQQARMMWRLGGDVGRAYALVRSAEQLAFPDGPYQLRLVVLHVLAGICQETGRLDEAAAASSRLVELTAAAGDRYVEATARLNIAHFALSNPDRVPRAPAPSSRSWRWRRPARWAIRSSWPGRCVPGLVSCRTRTRRVSRSTRSALQPTRSSTNP